MGFLLFLVPSLLDLKVWVVGVLWVLSIKHTINIYIKLYSISHRIITYLWGLLILIIFGVEGSHHIPFLVVLYMRFYMYPASNTPNLNHVILNSIVVLFECRRHISLIISRLIQIIVHLYVVLNGFGGLRG